MYSHHCDNSDSSRIHLSNFWNKAVSACLGVVLCIGVMTKAGRSFAADAPQTIKPLTMADHWQLLSYSSIPANTVSFGDNTMTLAVNQSASPVIFPLSRPVTLQDIRLQFSVDGQLNLADKKQGAKGADDFLFRLGVVYEGERTMNAFQRAFAPEWVTTLFDLAPEDMGVDSITFYNVYSDDRLTGKERQHPASDLLNEIFFQERPENHQTVDMTFSPDTDKKILALWISSDGDDTGSSYSVTLKNLELIEIKTGSCRLEC